MAEAVGLALGVAGLFSTCIQCFDVVVAGKDFSEDYEQLCTLFSLQRARFGLWGESVGLIQSPHDGRKLRYNKNLDRPDIRPGIERTLNNIKSLLDEAGQVDDRYGNKSLLASNDLSTSRGLNVFRTSFERFKANIKGHQKKTSAWKVTRWAIHDAEKFEVLIGRLKDFVDGLESITKSLGLLEEQHARLRQEIESISDTDSLRLLRDASSRHGSSHHDVSDTASRRLITVAESTLKSTGGGPSAGSFITARSGPSTVANSSSIRFPIPGSWPESVNAASRHSNRRPLTKTGWWYTFVTGKQHNRSDISCPDCLLPKSNFDPVQPITASVSVDKPDMTTRPGTDDIAGGNTVTTAMLPSGTYRPHMSLDLPQNQRLLSGLLSDYNPRQDQSFAAGDSEHGKKLASFKAEDEQRWNRDSVKYLTQASSGSSVAKRMFFELRNIKEGRVPFVSATLVGDSLTKLLASIEGPPETPYEGGIFWITIHFPDENPHTPPLMRFQTKIYHPNISPRGHICADYTEKWNAVLSEDRLSSSVKDPQGLWYQPRKKNAQWTLGALLTAICGLLASPDINDPLVPEIAQKYIEDYDGYVRNAKLYTQRFATATRPSSDQLVFLEKADLDESPSSSAIASPSLTMLESFNCLSRENISETIGTSLQESLTSDPATASPNPWIKHLPAPLIYGSLAFSKAIWRPGPYDFSGLMRMTRQGMSQDAAYDSGTLELSFAMLEAAVDFLEPSDFYIDPEIYTYYYSVRQCCAAYVRGQVTTRSIGMGSCDTKYPSMFKFKFDVTFKHKEPWSFIRTAKEVHDVLLIIADCVRDSQLSDIQSWCSVRTCKVQTCLVYRHLVHYALNRALKTETAKLLHVPAVLKFLRPRSSFDDQPKSDDRVAEQMDPESSCIWCRNQEFRSLLPTSLRSGKRISITGPYRAYSQDVTVAFGYIVEGSSTHLVWSLSPTKPPLDREVYRIESIDAVTQHKPSFDFGPHGVQIRYTSPEKSQLMVYLSFEYLVDAKTWFETLNLFRGILSSRERCLRRTSVEVEPPSEVDEPSELFLEKDPIHQDILRL